MFRSTEKPLKYANEYPPPNEDVDMVIDESTPLLPHQEIDESNKQISSELNTDTLN